MDWSILLNHSSLEIVQYRISESRLTFIYDQMKLSTFRMQEMVPENSLLQMNLRTDITPALEIDNITSGINNRSAVLMEGITEPVAQEVADQFDQSQNEVIAEVSPEENFGQNQVEALTKENTASDGDALDEQEAKDAHSENVPIQQKMLSRVSKAANVLMDKIKLHFFKISIEALNIAINHDALFKMIGQLNKYFNFIESIFILYPGDKKYSSSQYVYSFREKKIKWSPCPIGILFQDDKYSKKTKATIMFGITASESDILDPDNVNNLKNLNQRVENIKEMFSAHQKTYAGILAGVLFKKNIVKADDIKEADLTADGVVQSINLVKEIESLPKNTPVILLGGRGFIGKKVAKLLTDVNMSQDMSDDDLEEILKEHNIHVVDLHNENSWPSELSGMKKIVLNVTRGNALDDYVDHISDSIVLNEAYPPPKKETIVRLKNNKCIVYHIAGAVGKAFPPFPGAYSKHVPLCASQENFTAGIKKLS